jgi:hypothetical protein
MYDTKLVKVDADSDSFDVIWQEVKTLPTDQKAELVERLLGKESGLVLVSASSHLVDYIIAQMSLLSSEGLAHVMAYAAQEIAARVDSEGKSSRR